MTNKLEFDDTPCGRVTPSSLTLVNKIDAVGIDIHTNRAALVFPVHDPDRASLCYSEVSGVDNYWGRALTFKEVGSHQPRRISSEANNKASRFTYNSSAMSAIIRSWKSGISSRCPALPYKCLYDKYSMTFSTIIALGQS